MNRPQAVYFRTANGWVVMVDHEEIQGVTPPMIDWFSNHMTLESYLQWHPEDHKEFEWRISPSLRGHVGAVHRVVETFNGLPETRMTLEIEWLDSEVKTQYDHALLARVRGEGVDITLLHEYQQATPDSTLMRSYFHIVSQTASKELIEALVEHNKQEMQYFSHFLPKLYQSEGSSEPHV